jgi:hypothetical protein
MTTQTQIQRLAPTAAPLAPAWSRATLAGILADPARPRRTGRHRRPMVLAGAVALALTAGTAVATVGPSGVVKDALQSFADEPNTTGNGLGVLHDPALVARFRTPHGLFAFWVATSSSGTVCFAWSDGTWDGRGLPTKGQLDYGCGGEVADASGDRSRWLTDAEHLGGFFKDTQGPMVYGIAPYADAARVRVRGTGVDRTLPVRADSHGFGAALPEASRARAVTLTFLDAAGRPLGSRTWVAPIG